jgi:Tat protein translocase TatB subunit
MHSSSMSEMIFLFVLALVVVGPKRLPGLARQMGKFMAEFKRASNEFKHQLESEMINIELEEQAKKPTPKTPDEPQVLPPETNWQASVMKAQGVVSRGTSADISEAQTGSNASPPVEPRSPAKATSPDA